MVIGVCGYARSGKNSVADVLVKEYGFTQMAFADPMREMLLALDPMVEASSPENGVFYIRYSELVALRGYEQAKKEPDVRRLIQRLGTEAGRDVLGPDVWVNAVRTKLESLFYPNKVQMQSGRPHIVFSDVRFKNEYKLTADIGEVWRTFRLGEEGSEGTVPANEHQSETNCDSFAPARVIRAESLQELQNEVRRIMRGVRL